MADTFLDRFEIMTDIANRALLVRRPERIMTAARREMCKKAQAEIRPRLRTARRRLRYTLDRIIGDRDA